MHPVDRGDRLVRGRLHPLTQRVLAVQDAGRVALQLGDRVGDGRSRAGDLLHDPVLFRRHAGQFVQPPLVGLVEVDGRAHELPRPQRVPVPANGILERRLGCQFVGEELDQLSVGAGRLASGHGQAVGQGPVGGRPVRGGVGSERDEEGGLRVGQLCGLQDGLVHLEPGGHQPAAGAFAQGLDVAVDGLVDLAHAGRDVRPVVGGGGRHDVEHVAQPLQRGRDHVELGQVLPGLVQFEVEPQPVGHGGHRHPVDVVCGFSARQLGEGVAAQLRALVVAAGGEVGHLVVVPRDAHLGCGEGIQFRKSVGVGVGDGIDSGYWALSHPPTIVAPGGPHHPYSHP